MASLPSPDKLAVFIPMLIIAGGVMIALTAIIIGARSKELEHKERLMAMEKGIQIPEKKVESKSPHASRRATGLTFLGFGIALTIALWVVGDAAAGVWGFIPLCMGVAMLIASHFDKKEYEKEKGLD